MLESGLWPRSVNDSHYFGRTAVALKMKVIQQISVTLAASALQFRSRLCAVAQYAVLEANGKVNGIGEISHPSPLPNPKTNLDAASNISLTPPGSQCAEFD